VRLWHAGRRAIQQTVDRAKKIRKICGGRHRARQQNAVSVLRPDDRRQTNAVPDRHRWIARSAGVPRLIAGLRRRPSSQGDTSSSTITLMELSGCRATFPANLPCDRVFDQPQTVLDVFDQADQVRNYGAVGVIPAVGACATPSPAAALVHSLVTFLGVRCYLCVKPRSRTNTVRYGVRYRYPSVRHIQPRMDDGTCLRKPPPAGRSS
jgi:hypothetical protein